MEIDLVSSARKQEKAKDLPKFNRAALCPVDFHHELRQPRALEAYEHYWPQRLLHIPSMHVCQKKGKATYEGVLTPVTEPRYAALSYTWGRFEKVGEMSIAIHGVTWKPPSIDPTHFSVSQIRQTINQIRELAKVDYLWLDIACINISSPLVFLKDPEVRRQRHIFSSALPSFIWLSKTSTCQLSTIFRTLQSAAFLMERNMGLHIKDSMLEKKALSLAQGSFDELLADPWFSSLWTLQEAFANLDSIILSTESVPTYIEPESTVLPDCLSRQVPRETSIEDPSILQSIVQEEKNIRVGRPLVLRDLVLLSRRILLPQIDRVSVPWIQSNFPPASIKLRETILNSGLSSFSTFNLMSLYRLSQNREEKRPGDRIEYLHKYAFDFCSPNSEPPLSASYEDWFGKELVQHIPVLSQLFLHTKPSHSELSWKVTPTSLIPELEVIFHCFGTYVSVYHLNAERASGDDEGKQWDVTLEGNACSFNSLAINWLSQDSAKLSPNHLIGICFDSSIFACQDGSLLNFPCIYSLPRRIGAGSTITQEWSYSNAFQKNLLSNFHGMVESEDVRVLHMAYSPALFRTLNLAFGLIIIRKHQSSSSEIDTWQRLGFCFWVFTTDTKDFPAGQIGKEIEEAFLEGALAISKQWHHVKGQFR